MTYLKKSSVNWNSDRRHAKIEPLMKYDDNRQQVQRDVTELLDSMFD
ncbi:MAG: hypothetical protein PUP93_33700 [Rhizonema sp. NSF051]|nr:hypothetical protein [Rhizonema sp. NSF051]